MSVITDIVRAYAEDQIDFQYARESMRQVKSKPSQPDSPYVETYAFFEEGGPEELQFACIKYDLTANEYRLLCDSLYAKPVGPDFVDMNPPKEEPKPAEGPATPEEPASPGTLPDELNSPISITELLAPDDEDFPEREFVPSAPAEETPEKKVRKRLARLLKHYSQEGHETGTDQDVHDPTGGGGGGGESTEEKPTEEKPTAEEPSGRANRASRPTGFDQIIGQEGVTQRLKVMTSAAKSSGRQLDHVLLTGPPGLGKTTLAKVVGKELGANVIQITGPVLGNVDELTKVLSQLKDGDILFIDEIHAMSKPVQEILYPAMEDFEMDAQLDGRPVRVDLPEFTLIGATTNPEGLLSPLRDRFGSVEQLDYYEAESLAEIAKMTASKQGIELSDDAAMSIAGRSRGTPRAANRYVRRVRDVAEAFGHSEITTDTVDQAFKIWEVDTKGLTRDDRAVLSTLAQFEGRAAGLNTVASMTGLPENAIKDVIEPFLMREGLLQRTPSGRIITDAGKAHLQSVDFKKSDDSTFRIVKSDPAKNLVFGWANIAFTKDGQVEDQQGHLIDVEDLESGAYNFVVKYRSSGDEHTEEAFGELVESLVVTEDKIAKGGFPPEMLGHWWVGFRLPPNHWERVVKGERSMFSIQGNAKLVPFEDS